MERQRQRPKRDLQPLKLTEADYYTPPQAARVLGLSRRRVTQMLNERVLEGEKSDSGRWRISAAAVAQLLQERSREPLRPPRIAPVGQAIEEIKEQTAISEHRLERLTDTLSHLFTRLERLEDRLSGMEQRLNHQSL